MDASSQQRVQELTQEVITRFGTEFTLAYTECLVNACQAEVESNGEFKEASYQLDTAPIPAEPLKTGILTKEGGFFKNWKQRFFIAYNEADNWRIDYHEKEGGKLKGQVACCGYHAELFDEEDTKNKGEFGVKLVPWSKNRRTWYFRAPNKEEQEKWLDVFKTACYKAGPQKNKDPLVAQAFDIAYWRVRWWYCLWGAYTPWGTEDERLADLLMSIVDREVLWDVCNKLPANAMRSAAEAAIRNPIEITIKGAVGGSWTTAVSSVSSVSATIKNSVSQNIAPIIEQKVALKVKIVDLVNGVVQPILADKGGAVLRPVLAKACSPIAKAFSKAATDFNEEVTKLIGDNKFSEANFDSSARQLEYRMYWNMYKSYDIVYDMCFNGFADIMACLGNISMYSVYYMCKDALNEVYYNAVYTLTKYMKESNNYDLANQQTILADTMRKMVHDCKLATNRLIVKFLRMLLDTPVLELMIKPAKALVEPIQATIDAIPVINTLLNLTALTEETIEKIVKDSLTTLVQSGFASAMDSEFASIKL